MAEFNEPTYGAGQSYINDGRVTDPEGFIRQLAREAHSFTQDDLRKKPWYQKAYEHPGILTAVPKQERELLDDARQLYVLENLRKYYPPEESEVLPGYIQRPLAMYEANAPRLRSDYRDEGFTGAFNPESRAGAFLEWMDTTPTMATTASQGLANAADAAVARMYGREPEAPYPDASADFIAAGQTFLDGLGLRPIPAFAQWNEPRPDEVSYRQRRRDAASALDGMIPAENWWDGELLGEQPLTGARSQWMSAASDRPSQDEVLIDAGVPPAAAAAMGMLHSVVTDPFSNVGSAMRAARSGAALRGLRELGEEAAIPGGIFFMQGMEALGK